MQTQHDSRQTHQKLPGVGPWMQTCSSAIWVMGRALRRVVMLALASYARTIASLTCTYVQSVDQINPVYNRQKSLRMRSRAPGLGPTHQVGEDGGGVHGGVVGVYRVGEAVRRRVQLQERHRAISARQREPIQHMNGKDVSCSTLKAKRHHMRTLKPCSCRASRGGRSTYF
jgi:hypothetical protein